MHNVIDPESIEPDDLKDIIELEQRVNNYRSGLEDEERFKLYRLTRGVYGQRQVGAQMFRIKIPLGRLTTEQLVRIADTSDQYATGNLHITTRQDIQLHHVKLEDSVHVWTRLAEKRITARESCGNTVRNVTASAEAGIDALESFDMSPYAHFLAGYFLRNPICQEMGRKVKIAFSSSHLDTAMTFMHDFGFIPVLFGEKKGFKVFVGGGLGAQAFFAQEAHSFLPEEELIPFVEAALRVFDRYGEREKRHKARLKFLVKSIGLEEFLRLIEIEKSALLNKHVLIPADQRAPDCFPIQADHDLSVSKTDIEFARWIKTNTFEQRQKNYYGVYIKVLLGDLSSDDARKLAPIIESYASSELCLTINQNILLRYVPVQHLLPLYQALKNIGLASIGYDSIADVTACPGTDTCNLGVTNSTHLAKEIEWMIEKEYPDLLEEQHIKIKISGCMNACGQHMIANIGFHGSSIKRENLVIPALQVVLGGGVDPTGKPYIADKVIKIPTKRALESIRVLLDFYETNKILDEYFNHFYERMGGKNFFYKLLKPHADLETITARDLIDWGENDDYIQAIGVGECAGVMIDMVSTILMDAEDKLQSAKAALAQGALADSHYYAYSTMVIASKALLLSEDVSCNTQKGIIDDFKKHFIDTAKISLPYDYEHEVSRINSTVPSEESTMHFIINAEHLLQVVNNYRGAGKEKEVIRNFYSA